MLVAALHNCQGRGALLRGVRITITDTIDAEPTAPPASTIDAIRTYLDHLIAEGTSTERKAAIKALTAEIRITDERIIPVFKIPGRTPPYPSPRGPISANQGLMSRTGIPSTRLSS
jgi:hypothetical protein